MLKRITVNRFDSVSAGKVLGIIGVPVGILFGLLYGALNLIGNGSGFSNQPGEISLAVILVAMTLFVAPLVFGVFGFISGVFLAVIHNSTAHYFGGLIMEVEDDSEDDEA